MTKAPSKKQIERRVDAAMNKASGGLQIPLSKLNDMSKACISELENETSMSDDQLVQVCRLTMIGLGATVTP